MPGFTPGSGSMVPGSSPSSADLFRARSGYTSLFPAFGELPPEIYQEIGERALRERRSAGIPGTPGGEAALPVPQQFAPRPLAQTGQPMAPGAQPGDEMTPFMRYLLEQIRGGQAVAQQSAGPQYPMGPLGGPRRMPGSPSSSQGYQPPRVAGMPTPPAPSQRFPSSPAPRQQGGPYQAINLSQLQRTV